MFLGYKNYIEDLKLMVNELYCFYRMHIIVNDKITKIFWSNWQIHFFHFSLFVSITKNCNFLNFNKYSFQIIFCFSLYTQISYDLTYGKGNRLYVLPRWSIEFGWFLSILSILLIPISAIFKTIQLKQQNLIRFLKIRINFFTV